MNKCVVTTCCCLIFAFVPNASRADSASAKGAAIQLAQCGAFSLVMSDLTSNSGYETKAEELSRPIYERLAGRLANVAFKKRQRP